MKHARTEVRTSLRNTNLDGWDTLLGGEDLHVCTRWLLAIERAGVRRPLYVIRRGNADQFVAATVAYFVGEPGQDDTLVNLVRPDTLLAKLLTADEAVARTLSRLLPGFSCGGWTTVHSTVVWDRAGDVATQQEVLAGAMDATLECARTAGVRSVCFPYVAEEDQLLREALKTAGFQEFPAAPHYSLAITWPTFDGYLAHIPAKRRTKLKRDIARLRKADIAFEVVPLEEALFPVLLPLAVGTVEKHGGHTFELQVRRRLLALLDYGASVTIARRASEIRGFATVIERQGHLFMKLGGFDYEANGTLPVYFGILYEQVRLCIDRRLRALELGITLGSGKKLRGAQELVQLTYLRALDAGDGAHIADLWSVVNA